MEYKLLYVGRKEMKNNHIAVAVFKLMKSSVYQNNFSGINNRLETIIENLHLTTYHIDHQLSIQHHSLDLIRDRF